MIRLWLQVCFLVLVFPLGLFASEPDKIVLKEVVNALESPFRVRSGTLPAISDFKFIFVQDSAVVSLGQQQRAKGEAVFKFLPTSEKSRVSPLFRWEYNEPDEQLIVSDGREIWFYVPENKQAIRSEARQALRTEKGNNPLMFLTNLGELSRFFEIRWFQDQPEQAEDYFLELIPLEKSPLIKTIVMGVHKEIVAAKGGLPVFPIHTLLLANVNDDLTRIEIIAAEVNQRPAEKLFHFLPPPGTEILTPEDIQRAF